VAVKSRGEEFAASGNIRPLPSRRGRSHGWRRSIAPHRMNTSTKMILLGIALGYVLSPMLDRVPVVNKLPKLG